MNRIRLVVAFVILISKAGISAEPPARIEITEAIIDVAHRNNEFSTNLYSRLRSDQPANMFFSPYSISTALAMTWSGAEGQTRSQMAQVLHLPNQGLEANSAMKSLRAALATNSAESGFQLRIANRLWGQNGFQFLPEFTQSTKADYGADLGLLDFKQSDAARKSINDWIEEQTDHKIQNLIAPGVLNASTRLILTNAIYFKAHWTSEFNKAVTESAAFHLSGSKQVMVPTMRQLHHFRYTESENVQVLELPYGHDHSLSMLVLLPKTIDGLTNLEKQLSSENLQKWSVGLKSRKVNVQLPKFKMTSEFGLKDVLSSMGMPLAFSREADFSKISTQERLFISAVIHKAFVDVNEEGTEAAAATAIAVAKSSIAIEVEKPIEFRADHPFVFMIRHTETNCVLFLGRLMNPKD